MEPITPPGLGIGHSRFNFASLFASSSICLNSAASSAKSRALSGPVEVVVSASVSSMAFFLLRRILCGCPSAVIAISESANAFRGAGQGKRWGMPTMKNDARSVTVKRDVVALDRG